TLLPVAERGVEDDEAVGWWHGITPWEQNRPWDLAGFQGRCVRGRGRTFTGPGNPRTVRGPGGSATGPAASDAYEMSVTPAGGYGQGSPGGRGRRFPAGAGFRRGHGREAAPQRGPPRMRRRRPLGAAAVRSSATGPVPQ